MQFVASDGILVAMESQVKRPVVGVGVIVCRDQNILIGLRKTGASPVWQFPGGHLEFNETLENCAQREVKEETGLAITSVRAVTFTNDINITVGKHSVTLFAIADCPIGEPMVTEPDKSSDWHWVTWETLPQPLFLPIRNLLAKGYHPFLKP